MLICPQLIKSEVCLKYAFTTYYPPEPASNTKDNIKMNSYKKIKNNEKTTNFLCHQPSYKSYFQRI